MHKRDDPAWEWSVFWQSDQLQSCMPVNEPVESDQLALIWRAFFDALPEGANLMDLGTGNGSLAIQAVEASQARQAPFSIDAVDLADIEPARFISSQAKTLQQITFHPCTAMEKLPFADSHFDAVASQYAIEYSQVDKSLRETIRVLKPNGRFRFLLHADDGVLKKRCELQRQQADIILESRLFTVLAEVIEKIVIAEQQQTPQTLTRATQSITALTGVFDDLELQFSAHENRSLVDNLFTAAKSLPGLRQRYDLATLLSIVDDTRLLLTAQGKRLQAMADAALDDAAVTKLAKQMVSLGATKVDHQRAVTGEQEVCVGHWLFGEKAIQGTHVA